MTPRGERPGGGVTYGPLTDPVSETTRLADLPSGAGCGRCPGWHDLRGLVESHRAALRSDLESALAVEALSSPGLGVPSGGPVAPSWPPNPTQREHVRTLASTRPLETCWIGARAWSPVYPCSPGGPERRTAPLGSMPSGASHPLIGRFGDHG